MKLIRSLAFVRVALVPLAVTKIVLDADDFPSQGYERAAWAVVGAYAVVALLLVGVVVSLARPAAVPRGAERRYGLRDHDRSHVRVRVGAGSAPAVTAVPGRAGGRALLPARRRVDRRSDHVPDPARPRSRREAQFDIPVRYDALVLRVVVAMALGAVVGRLVDMERGQAHDAEERAEEAERLRDELGRRVDLLEATNRAARALGSSLDLERAFAAFVRELRSLLPFDRAAILLAEGGGARVMATAGIGAQDYLEPGTAITVPGEILEAVIEEGRTIYREDIAVEPVPGGSRTARAGVHARVLAPLQLGTRSIGALAIARTEPGPSARRKSAW